MGGSPVDLPTEARSLLRAFHAWKAAPRSTERESAYRAEAAAYRKGHLLRPGEIVADRFQVEEHLSDGPLCARWSAVDLHDDSRAYVEILHARFFGVPGLLERFHAAASAQQASTAPAVVPVRDAGGEWEGFHWVAYERVGRPLPAERASLDATGRA